MSHMAKEKLIEIKESVENGIYPPITSMKTKGNHEQYHHNSKYPHHEYGAPDSKNSSNDINNRLTQHQLASILLNMVVEPLFIEEFNCDYQLALKFYHIGDYNNALNLMDKYRPIFMINSMEFLENALSLFHTSGFILPKQQQEQGSPERVLHQEQDMLELEKHALKDRKYKILDLKIFMADLFFRNDKYLQSVTILDQLLNDEATKPGEGEESVVLYEKVYYLKSLNYIQLTLFEKAKTAMDNILSQDLKSSILHFFQFSIKNNTTTKTISSFSMSVADTTLPFMGESVWYWNNMAIDFLSKHHYINNNNNNQIAMYSLQKAVKLLSLDEMSILNDPGDNNKNENKFHQMITVQKNCVDILTRIRQPQDFYDMLMHYISIPLISRSKNKYFILNNLCSNIIDFLSSRIVVADSCTTNVHNDEKFKHAEEGVKSCQEAIIRSILLKFRECIDILLTIHDSNDDNDHKVMTFLLTRYKDLLK